MSFEMIQANLSDFINFRNGKSSPDRDPKGEFDVYGSNGVIGQCAEKNAPEFSLIIGRVGSYCGSVYQSKKACWVTDNAIIGALKNKNESDFWYFLLTKLNINSMSSGSGQPLINQKILNSIQVTVPKSSKVREDIGAFLSLFNEKIKINEDVNQTLELMAQALFKSWFIDFEPVKAKIRVLEAGGSHEDATLAAIAAISGKDADELVVFEHEHPMQNSELHATANLFPSALQESKFGKIPEKWTISEIGKEIDIVGGGTPSTKISEFWDNGDIHWTTPKDLSGLQDKILIHTERRITQSGLSKISSGLLPVDTVLMSSRAPVGYLAISKIPIAINQGYIAMKCSYELSPEFVLQWCAANMPEILARASGTTFAEISKKNFNPIPLVKPPAHLVNVYTQKVKLLYLFIENNCKQTRELINIREAITPKLLSGEISIEEISNGVL
ncbi:restriction endonuclease subunit S [Lelliottia sp.]|uniref:restriction endonuclease subunit S n=1 Tax=Lelliottia sp. TaxID=1898429 RepID=UPI00388F8C49